MNRTETTHLLAVVQSFDRRTVGEADVIAWHSALSDLEPEACRQAVIAYYASSTDWIMPAHVRTRVLASRQDGAMRRLPADPGELKPMPDWFRAEVAEHAKEAKERNRGARDRGEPVSFGEMIVRTLDGRR